ncbi:hypothetical protein [Halalkalibaculum sp. DA384]|uniref:hypothetical protein n=1 Tax=Halalkalibaculum sp. DA384 TaxID=3373606 RepID=UPI003754B6F9
MNKKTNAAYIHPRILKNAKDCFVEKTIYTDSDIALITLDIYRKDCERYGVEQWEYTSDFLFWDLEMNLLGILKRDEYQAYVKQRKKQKVAS